MKSMTLRGVDVEVYEYLQALAKKNHRSLQEQVRCILQREVELIRGSSVKRAKNIRNRLRGRDWGDITGEIREDRQR